MWRPQPTPHGFQASVNARANVDGQVYLFQGEPAELVGSSSEEEDEIIVVTELRPQGQEGARAVREKVGDIVLLEHAITHGDNLNKLALQYGCKVADLKCVNNLMQEQDLYALKSVKIPVKKHSLLTVAPSLTAPATPPRSLAPCPEGYADFLKEIDHIERLAKGRGVQQGLLSDTPEGPLRTGTGQATPNHSADWGIQWWTTVALMLLVGVILPLFYVVYYRTQNGSADTLGDGMGNICLSTSDATLTNISASPRKRVSQILNRPLS